MKPGHDERFRRIVEDYLERPGGDDAELLRRGQVSLRTASMRSSGAPRSGRRLAPTRSGVVTIRDGDRAIAARQRSIPKDQELAKLTRKLDRSVVLRGLAERARQLGHEIGSWLRHDEENIVTCTRCAARMYARFDTAPTGRRRRSARRQLPSGLTIP